MTFLSLPATQGWWLHAYPDNRRPTGSIANCMEKGDTERIRRTWLFFFLPDRRRW